MRLILILFTGMVAASVCVADPAPPYGIDLLSDLGNLDIKAGQWTLSGGILSPLHPEARFAVVKEGVCKVPVWFSLRCDLVNIQKQNDRLPEAGVLFGFIDEKNYWGLMLGQELSQPVLKLVQVKDGKTMTATSVPLTIKSAEPNIAISVEVHHGRYVKAHANGSLVLTHEVSDGIARGQIGFTLQSGSCGFSNASISGIAKH